MKQPAVYILASKSLRRTRRLVLSDFRFQVIEGAGMTVGLAQKFPGWLQPSEHPQADDHPSSGLPGRSARGHAGVLHLRPVLLWFSETQKRAIDRALSECFRGDNERARTRCSACR
jgi:hypothetical protein